MKNPKFKLGQKVKVLIGFSVITKIKKKDACVGIKVKITKNSIYKETPTTFRSIWIYEIEN